MIKWKRIIPVAILAIFCVAYFWPVRIAPRAEQIFIGSVISHGEGINSFDGALVKEAISNIVCRRAPGLSPEWVYNEKFEITFFYDQKMCEVVLGQANVYYRSYGHYFRVLNPDEVIAKLEEAVLSEDVITK